MTQSRDDVFAGQPAPSATSSLATADILIVDDEPIVLNALKFTLEREGFHVTTCTSPLKALTVISDRAYSVIISDQRMPEMTGLDFLMESRRICPNSSRILITAVLALPTLIDAINKGEIFRFVAKPWLREELVLTVRNAVQRHDLLTRNEALHSESAELNARLREANSMLAAKVCELEAQRDQLATANRDLVVSNERFLALYRRILAIYDPVLGAEANAVVELATQMAAFSSFTPAEGDALRTAASLCDLGLIAVPRQLLRTFRSQSAQLTEGARAVVYRHPIQSELLATQLNRTDVAEIVRGHHERFDGSGYPDGRSGNAIPWLARCLAVVVAFVESQQSKSTTLDCILAGAGTDFDPEAVRLFLEVGNRAEVRRRIREIPLRELAPGMALVNGIYTAHGLLLASENEILTAETIASILGDDRAGAMKRLLIYG
jgi:response regulator RpfG family c-di-GMP phosphodiesterase